MRQAKGTDQKSFLRTRSKHRSKITHFCLLLTSNFVVSDEGLIKSFQNATDGKLRLLGPDDLTNEGYSDDMPTWGA